LEKIEAVSNPYISTSLRQNVKSESYTLLLASRNKHWGAVVWDVNLPGQRTIFERRNDATIYIPSFYPTLDFTIS